MTKDIMAEKPFLISYLETADSNLGKNPEIAAIRNPSIGKGN